MRCLADRLYLGSSVGSLHIYSLKQQQGEYPTVRVRTAFLTLFPDEPGNGQPSHTSFELEEVRKGVARRSIEQLGFIKDVNSLVVLSGEHGRFMSLLLDLSFGVQR